MKKNFLTRGVTLFLVLVLASVPSLGQEDFGAFKTLEENAKEIFEWYGNPAEEAAIGLPRILLGEALDNEGKDERLWTNDLTGIYVPSTDESIVQNVQCRHDVAGLNSVFRVYLLPILLETHLWPLLLPDSWGKPGDGILDGNFMPWGLKEECINLHVDEQINSPLPPLIKPLNITFRGNYCLVHIKNDTSSMNTRDSRISEMDAVQVLLDILETPKEYFYGTCIPSSCTGTDMMVSLAAKLNTTDWRVVDVQCRTEDEAGELSSGDKAFIAIVSILWFLIIGAAIVDLTINLYDAHKHREGRLKYLLAFSGYRSMQAIFRISNKTNPESIDCLHGLRALSMIWVTWCHSYLLFVKVTQNVWGLKPLTSSMATQIIFNGSFSVDTFIFISGLLATYTVLIEHDVTGKVNWVMYYVHRIVRLLPSIALTCFFMATVARHAVVGPYGPYVDKENLEICRDYWYKDILFISNFFPESERCLPQSWYTSVDSQLYFILPIVLVPLILKPKLGFAILSLLTLGSFALPTGLYYAYDLKPYLPFVIPEIQPQNTTLDHDKMPWNRASPYFIGVIGGWILFRLRKKKIKMPWVIAVIGWLVSATLSSFVLFCLVRYNTLDDPKVLPSEMSIAYGGLSRGLWGLSLLWVVIACHKGYGGPINAILGHQSLWPLSRLSYTMYLITVPVQILTTGGTLVPLYMNHLNKFIETCGYLFISGLLAIAIAITAEIPLISLQKVLIDRPGRNVQEETPKEA